MLRHSFWGLALGCGLTLVQLGVAGPGPATAVVQDGTPAATLGDLPDGVAFEPIAQGGVDEVLLIARLMRVSRVTLLPDASQATYTVLPAVYVGEEGTTTFDVDRELTGAGRLVRADGDGTPRRSFVVLPGTSLDLRPEDALAVPGTPDVESPYASISARNRSDAPATYIDIEIFPTSNPHVLQSAGDPVSQGLDVNLGLATAQEPAPDWIVVDRLTLQPGASAVIAVDAPLLAVAQEGALSLSVDDGEAALQRSGTRWGDAPETLISGDSTDLTDRDAAFLLPGTTGAVTNAGPAPVTALLVTILAPEVP